MIFNIEALNIFNLILEPTNPLCNSLSIPIFDLVSRSYTYQDLEIINKVFFDTQYVCHCAKPKLFHGLSKSKYKELSRDLTTKKILLLEIKYNSTTNERRQETYFRIAPRIERAPTSGGNSPVNWLSFNNL